MTNEWLRYAAMALAGGVIGLLGSLLLTRRVPIVASEAARPQISIHAWYVTGILAFLLICTLSVDWGAIPELVTILSFAVGLASLILALIAIIQALTSSGQVSETLAAIKSVAKKTRVSSDRLEQNVGAIIDAATAAEKSTASALAAIERIVSLRDDVMRGVEQGTAEIKALRDQLSVESPIRRTKIDAANQASIGAPHTFVVAGVAPVEALLLSEKTSRAFTLTDILGEDMPRRFFEFGYMASLRDTGVVDFSQNGFEISDVRFNIARDEWRGRIDNRVFKDGQDLYETYLGNVQAHFEEPTPANAADAPPLA